MRTHVEIPPLRRFTLCYSRVPCYEIHTECNFSKTFASSCVLNGYARLIIFVEPQVHMVRAEIAPAAYLSETDGNLCSGGARCLVWYFILGLARFYIHCLDWFVLLCRLYSRYSAVHTVIWGKSKCRHIAVRRPCAKLGSSVYRRYFVRKCVCVLIFPAFGRSCSCMSVYWLWAFFYNIILHFAQLKMWIKYY